MIGIGTRLPDDPVLHALQEFKLKPHLFSVAVPGYGPFPGNEQAEAPRANGNQVRFGVPQEPWNNQNQMAGGLGRAPPAQTPQRGQAPQTFNGNAEGQRADGGRPPQVQIPPDHVEAQPAGPVRTPFPQTPGSCKEG
jgi:hypothetical protein